MAPETLNQPKEPVKSPYTPHTTAYKVSEYGGCLERVRNGVLDYLNSIQPENVVQNQPNNGDAKYWGYHKQGTIVSIQEVQGKRLDIVIASEEPNYYWLTDNIGRIVSNR